MQPPDSGNNLQETMAHISLPEGFPGIRGPMMFRPETAKPLNELVDVLLRGPHTLSPADRELIATYVSARNDCTYCQTIHAPSPRIIWAVTRNWSSA
jgi:alkylhydroperoxidase family enzyme